MTDHKLSGEVAPAGSCADDEEFGSGTHGFGQEDDNPFRLAGHFMNERTALLTTGDSILLMENAKPVGQFRQMDQFLVYVGLSAYDGKPVVIHEYKSREDANGCIAQLSRVLEGDEERQKENVRAAIREHMSNVMPMAGTSGRNSSSRFLTYMTTGCAVVAGMLVGMMVLPYAMGSLKHTDAPLAIHVPFKTGRHDAPKALPPAQPDGTHISRTQPVGAPRPAGEGQPAGELQAAPPVMPSTYSHTDSPVSLDDGAHDPAPLTEAAHPSQAGNTPAPAPTPAGEAEPDTVATLQHLQQVLLKLQAMKDGNPAKIEEALQSLPPEMREKVLAKLGQKQAEPGGESPAEIVRKLNAQDSYGVGYVPPKGAWGRIVIPEPVPPGGNLTSPSDLKTLGVK